MDVGKRLRIIGVIDLGKFNRLALAGLAWPPPPEVVSLANFMQHVDVNFEEPIAVEQTPRRFELLAEQQKDTKRGQTISLRP